VLFVDPYRAFPNQSEPLQHCHSSAPEVLQAIFTDADRIASSYITKLTVRVVGWTFTPKTKWSRPRANHPGFLATPSSTSSFHPFSLHPYYAFLLQSLVPYSITSQSSVPGVDGEYNTPSGSHFFRIFSSLEYTSFPQK